MDGLLLDEMSADQLRAHSVGLTMLRSDVKQLTTLTRQTHEQTTQDIQELGREVERLSRLLADLLIHMERK